MTAVESHVQGLQGFQFQPSIHRSPRPSSYDNTVSHAFPDSYKNASTRANINKPFHIFPNHPNVLHENGFDYAFNNCNMRPIHRKFSYDQSTTKVEHQYYYNEMIMRSAKQVPNRQRFGSTCSDSDSTASHSSSELNGFRIVHRGKILHDETEEELDSLCQLNSKCAKFASSEFELGPSSKSISLPSFTDIDQNE